MVLALLAVLPRAWVLHQRRAERQGYMEELMHLNASGLKKQKQASAETTLSTSSQTILQVKGECIMKGRNNGGLGLSTSDVYFSCCMHRGSGQSCRPRHLTLMSRTLQW